MDKNLDYYIKYRKFKKAIGVLIVVFLLVYILMMGFIFNQINDNIKLERKNEVVMDLFMFSINLSNHCTKINNMSYEDLTQDYIRNMTEQLISSEKK